MIASGGLAWAGEPPQKVVRIDDPRTVTVGERSVVPIYLAQFQETMLVLPAQEKVVRVFVSDTSNWIAETGKSQEQLSRYISLKVKDPLSKATTLNVVSDHDKPYTFKLMLTDDHCDSKVFIDPDSQLAQEISKEPAFVAASELQRYKDAAADAKKQADVEVKKAHDAEDSYRTTYPETLKFDYTWDRKKGDILGVREIFNDGKFTYIRATPQEAPALYEIKDGKPSIVHFDFRNGVYTVTKLIDKGYLAVGKTRCDFARTAEN
jgi:type IV secretion system protein VirB9